MIIYAYITAFIKSPSLCVTSRSLQLVYGRLLVQVRKFAGTIPGSCLTNGISLGLSPFPVVTTRIVSCLIGNPNLNLHFHYWEGGQPNISPSSCRGDLQ